MADTQPPRVDNEILQMWRRDGRLYAIAGFLVGVMVFPLLASLGGDRLTGFLQELVPEMVGIGITVFLIDRIIRRRDERNAEAALKRQLLDDAASTSNEIAKNAVHQLRRKGWLVGENGLLKEANLRSANLRDADLIEANLQHVDFIGANLQGANLYGANLWHASLLVVNLQDADLAGANLQGADVDYTNLEGANLYATNLQGASIREANLERTNLRWARLENADLSRTNLHAAKLEKASLQMANLQNANLQNANLDNANLQGANLEAAEFHSRTVLPDSTHWTPESDMTRFTDPKHPNFWRSDQEWWSTYLEKSEE